MYEELKSSSMLSVASTSLSRLKVDAEKKPRLAVSDSDNKIIAEGVKENVCTVCMQ